MLCTVVGVAFLYFILFFPFLVSVYSYVDVKEKFGVYCIKFIGIRIVCGRATIKGAKLQFENETNLIKLKDKKLSRTVKVAIYLIYRFLDIVSVLISFSCGDKENPAKAAITCGTAHSLFGSIFAVLKTKNKRANFVRRVNYFSDEDEFSLLVKMHAAICLFDVVKSFVFARIEAGRSVQTKMEGKYEQ